jgi:phosphoribosylanthranilate isomerase
MLATQRRIKRDYPQVAIMRSIPIAPPGLASQVPTLELADMFAPVSDFFLTDTLLLDHGGMSEGQQPVEGFVGITGRTCDWDMAATLVQTSRLPVILAGGLAPHNVFEGILKVRPAGVDSCTGTNATDAQGGTIRFKKDMLKVRRFVAQTRSAEQHLEAESA